MPLVAEALTKQHKMIIQETRNMLLGFCVEKPRSAVLDVGCGNGDFTIKLAGKLKTDNVFGFDFDPTLVEDAKKKGIKAVCQDFNKSFPYADSSFDVICASQVIELTLNTDLFVREIYRVLRLGGYLLISTPNLASLHNILLLSIGQLPPMVKVSNETSKGATPRFLLDGAPLPNTIRARMFTCSALRGLLSYHGFEIEIIRGCGYYPLPNLLQKGLAKIDRTHVVQIAAKAIKT